MNASFLKKALPHVIAILVFLIVAIIYCKPALEGKVVNQTDMLGYKGMAHQSYEYKDKYGHVPLWTESLFAGMPAYSIANEPRTWLPLIGSTIQTAITLGFYTTGTPEKTPPLNTAGFFFLACITFYFLALVMRINPWIGVLAALAYSWSTYDPIIVAVGHVTKMLAIGYAPAVIASLLLIYRGKYLWGGVLLALFASLQMNTQHLQVIFYTLISAGILTICYLIYNWRKDLKAVIAGVVIIAIGFAIGYASMAVLILPTNEYAKETMRGGRTELRHASSKNESTTGLSKEYAFNYSYGIPETFTLIVPRSAGGGGGGKEIGDNSKMAEKLSETFNVPGDQAVEIANSDLYWGGQELGTFGPVYLGAIVCFLFILGMVYVKGWPKWWLFGVALVGILLAWGKNFSAFNYFLFDHLPYYNKFRSPTIALVMPQFAFPLLGALGLQEVFFGSLSKEEKWKKLKTTLFWTGGLLIVLIGYYIMADYSNPARDSRTRESYAQGLVQRLANGKQPTQEMQQQAVESVNSIMKGLKDDRQSAFGSDLLRSIILIGLAALLIGLFIKEKVKQKQILLGGLIVLTGFDLLAIDLRYLTENNFVDPDEFEASLAPTPADIRIKGDPEKNFRVFDPAGGGDGAFQMSIESARASYNHNSVGGYSPAKLGLFEDLKNEQLQKGNIRVYSMLNTKYFIVPNRTSGQPEAQQNPYAFGPAWLVKSIHYVANGDEEMKALDSINTRDTAIIQAKYKGEVKFNPAPDSSASIKIVDNLLDKITYKFSSRTDQFAVFSEIYYPEGWNAFIDGKKTDYLRVDYLLRGMPVPAGDHTIEFRFEPRTYFLGNAITTWSNILLWIMLIGAILWEVVRARKKSTTTA